MRRIAPQPWQRAFTETPPRALIRGLIHSDGCRVINRFGTALPSGRLAESAYPRYFSNASTDVREIFREHCGRLGVRVTQSNPRNLTVSHCDSIAILDSSSAEDMRRRMRAKGLEPPRAMPTGT
jgi:hypothetical protein